MKRIMTIFLSLVMILSCSYTAMANVVIDTNVKIIDKNGTRDISSILSDRYVTDDYVLMVPAEEILKELGFGTVKWDSNKKILTFGRVSDQRKVAMYCGGSLSGVYAYTCKNLDGRTLTEQTIAKPTIRFGKPMIAIKDLVNLAWDTVRVDPATSTFYIARDGYETDYIYSLPTCDTWEENAKAGTLGNSYVAKKDLIPLYSADGRIRYTRPDEVEAYKKVGWYETCPIVGKTYWFSTIVLPYYGFEPNSQYMNQRTKWLSRAITGYNALTLEPINENQYKITEFYYWENNKLITVKADTLLTGNMKISRNILAACDQNPKVKYGLSDWEWNKIQNKEYTFLGMSYNGFKLAGHGTPDKINRTTTSYGTHEQWVYRWSSGTDYYYFDNGRLTAWQD